MARVLIFLGLQILVVFCVNSQKLLGIPEIKSFSNDGNTPSSQNWKIRQDKDGLIYVANNEGVHCYDGNQWTLFKLPTKTQLRALEINNGKIFVGGVNEMGYFFSNAQKKLTYSNLTKFINGEHQNFGTIWSISVNPEGAFFRSSKCIFKWNGKEFTTFFGEDWRFMGIVDGTLFAQDGDEGLYEYKSQKWVPSDIQDKLPIGTRISNMLKYGTDSILIVTQNHGFFINIGKKIFKYESPTTYEISNSIISAAVKIGNCYAVGTRSKGLYILDSNLKLVEHLTRSDGLHNNHVITIFSDFQSNIWIGLDNGIDMLAFNSPLRKIYPDPNDIGAGYASAFFNEMLYLGTANGLYYAPIKVKTNEIKLVDSFKKVEGSKGQVWNLNIIKNSLYMAHHNGAFRILGQQATSLDNSTGYWKFELFKPTNTLEKLIGLNYKGLASILPESPNSLTQEVEIKGGKQLVVFNNKSFTLGQNGELLIGNLNDLKSGLTPMKFPASTDTAIIESLTTLNQIPLISTNVGIFIYQSTSGSFIPEPILNKIFNQKTPYFLGQDNKGLLWFVLDKVVGFISDYPQSAKINYTQEHHNNIIPSAENLTKLPNDMVILGTESGFTLYNLTSDATKLKTLTPKITRVSISHPIDSTLFEGNGTYNNTNVMPAINPGYQALIFQYSTPHYLIQPNIQYSFILQGLDDNWSSWSVKNTKEYTNLPPGVYTFKVKANYNGKVSEEYSAITFRVMPKWYESKIFKILISSVILTIIGFLFRFQQKRSERLLKQQQQEQEKQRYLQQLEIDRNEKEIVKLQNEKLANEINYKNAELASTAMHLLQKGDFIEKLKSELSHLTKLHMSDSTKQGLNKIIKSLGEAERIDSDWEIFAKHFDQTHKDFLDNLKKKFPTLTPNEIKLCAFIKIDLSTKEIAQLLNISKRGVEISRYRLRRKMEIPNRLTFHTFLAEQGL